MATALYSFKVDDDGKVRVGHVFFGLTEAAARKALEEHAAVCPKFGPAHRGDATIEMTEELDALPAPDEESLKEFLGFDEDDEDELEEEEEERR